MAGVKAPAAIESNSGTSTASVQFVWEGENALIKLCCHREVVLEHFQVKPRTLCEGKLIGINPVHYGLTV